MNFFKRIKKAFGANEEISIEPDISKTTFNVRYEIIWKEDIELSERDFEKTVCCNDVKFCKVLMEMNKVYSRAEIEQISARLGYSVWDNIGGATNKEGYPICSCKWNPVVVVKKDA